MALTLPLPPAPSLPAAFNGVRPFLRGGLPPAAGAGAANGIVPLIRPALPAATRAAAFGPKGAAVGLALLAGAVVGGLLWGYLNRRTLKPGGAPGQGEQWATWPAGQAGDPPQPGENLYYGIFQGTNRIGPNQTGPGTQWRLYPTGRASSTGQNVWRIGPGSWEQLVNRPDGSWVWETRTTFQRQYVEGPFNGVWLYAALRNWGDLPGGQAGYTQAGIYKTDGTGVTFFTGGGGHRNLDMPVTVQPLSGPGDLEFGRGPQPDTGPDPLRVPSPAPLIEPLAPSPQVAPTTAPAPPLTPDTVPQADPVSPGETNPRRRVAPPVTPERSRPRPLLPPPLDPDTTTPTGPDGKPRERQEPGPTTRDPRVISIPGGEVGQPGAQPRPDLQGIAAELGKLEQKLELSLSLQLEATGGGEEDPLLREIADLLQAPFPAGSFQLFPACDRDAQGEPLPPAVAPWGAGAGPLELLSRKLDALQDLIQAHKDFRQPVCRSKPIGEEVTVTFEEVP